MLNDDFLDQVDQRIAAAKAPAQGQPQQAQPEVQWNDVGPAGVLGSVGDGLNRAVLATGDLIPDLTGNEGWMDQNVPFWKDYRASVDRSHERLTGADNPQALANSLTSGISEFTAGMVGAGKLMAPLKVGAEMAKGGRIAYEAARGAAAGFTVMDPQEERLSNLLEEYPTFAQPVFEFLATKEGDTGAEGRLKNALEGIGLDLAIAGTFALALRALKVSRGGDAETTKAAFDQLEKTLAEQAPAKKLPAGQNVVADALQPAPGGVQGPEVTGPQVRGPKVRGPKVKGPKVKGPEVNGPEVGTNPIAAEIEGGMRDPALPATRNLLQDQLAAGTPAPGAARDTEIAIGSGTAGDPTVLPELEVGAPTKAGDLIEPVRTEAQGLPATSKGPGYQPSIKIGPEDGARIAQGARTVPSPAAQVASGAASRPSVPWQKLNTTEDVEALISETTSAVRAQMDAAKGGDVLTDTKVRAMVKESADLFGADPELVLGEIARSGDQATHMVADMEAAYLIARRMFEEVHALSGKIEMGLLDEFGGDAAKADTELVRRMTVAADMLAQGNSMRAAMGRGMRRLRSQFALTPDDVAALKSLPPERLRSVLSQTGGDVKKLAQATSPGFWRKISNEASFLLVNNLLWNWPTHVVNTTTSMLMLAMRPAEKLLGSLVMGSKGSAIRKQAMREYLYTTTSIFDASRAAIEAFLKADSKLIPHNTEMFEAGSRVNQPRLGLKPIKDVWDLFYNGMVSLDYRMAGKAAGQAAVGTFRVATGLPTRTLGTVDEFVKQLRYRAVVQAKAAVEGSENGLKGQALKDHIAKRLEDSMSPTGVALDDRAAYEAQVATFQQNLLEGTIGKAVQNLRHNFAPTSFVLPFVKGPTNVLRYGVKMTPGLNYLVQSEYRQQLMGKMGAEAQAQAMGQMAVGSLVALAAAGLAINGKITGGGPSDLKLKKQLQSTGWQAYSYVLERPDGTKTYIPLGRFDPVTLPMTLVADLLDMHVLNPNSGRSESGITATIVAITSVLSEKSYLVNFNQLVQAMADPGDDGENVAKYLGNTANNMIPGSSAIRNYVNNDEYLREARNYVDRMMKDMPGYADASKQPPQRDSFGDPIWRTRGLVTGSNPDIVESEQNRFILETGKGVLPPSPTGSFKGIDLRDVTLSDGRNAFDIYQELTASPPNKTPLKDSLARLIQSPGYDRLVDGDGQTTGTKLAAVNDIVGTYRELARKEMLKKYPELRTLASKAKYDLKAQLGAKRQGGSTKTNTNSLSDMIKSMGY